MKSLTTTEKIGGAAAVFCLIAALTLGMAGCMTSKVTSVDSSGHTNTVTVVNEVNLAIDCEAIKLAAAGQVVAVMKLTHADPTVVTALTDAHTALDGVLNGVNKQTSQEILDTLNKSGNATLAKEAQSFANLVSSIEQKYLNGVSASVAGEITLKINQAICDGLALGLGF